MSAWRCLTTLISRRPALFAVYLALGGDPEVKSFQLGDDRGTHSL